MNEDALGGPLQGVAAGELDDAPVEAQIRLGILVEVRRDALPVEAGEDLAQRGDRAGGGVLRDQPGSHALERGPDDDDLEQFCLALARDRVAAPRHRPNQPFVFQPQERFPDRRPAHAEARGKFALVQTQIGLRDVIQVGRRDGTANFTVYTGGDARVRANVP